MILEVKCVRIVRNVLAVLVRSPLPLRVYIYRAAWFRLFISEIHFSIHSTARNTEIHVPPLVPLFSRLTIILMRVDHLGGIYSIVRASCPFFSLPPATYFS